MRKLVMLGIAGLMTFGANPAAFADRYGGGDRGDCNREGNCNDQRRCQGDHCTDNHKSFSPDLKDSPVTICMPGSTCYFDGNGQKKGDKDGGKDGQGEDPQPGETPRSQPNPACLLSLPYHCDQP